MFARLKWAWQNGWRTLGACAGLIALSVAEIFQQVDIRPILRFFVSDDHMVEFIIAALALFFAFMRVVSSKPVGNILKANTASKVDDGE